MRILFIGAAVAALLLSGGLPAFATDTAAANEAAAEAGQPTAKENPLHQGGTNSTVNPIQTGNDRNAGPRDGRESDHSAGKGNEKTTPAKSDVGPVKWMAPEATAKDRMSGAQTNPLYQDSGAKGQNPVHEAK